MPLPDPPYTYDDGRLTYDEHCFFYDGGYDSFCLAADTAVIVRTGKRTHRDKPKPFLNVFVRCCVCKVNGVEIPCEELEGWMRFSGEEDPLSVFINGIAIKMKTPYASGYLKNLVNSQNQMDGLKMSLDFIQQMTEKGPECIIEPEPDTGTNIDIQIVEPYNNIEVICNLIPATTSSLKVESQIITNKKRQK